MIIPSNKDRILNLKSYVLLHDMDRKSSSKIQRCVLPKIFSTVHEKIMEGILESIQVPMGRVMFIAHNKS